jgi:hypothetical protein
LLDSLLQEVVATLLHLVFQKPSTAKNEKAPTIAGTEKYGVTGAYTCFKKYCEKEA